MRFQSADIIADIIIDNIEGNKSFTLKSPEAVDEFVIQVNCPCNLFIRIAQDFGASKLILRSEVQGVFVTIRPPYTNVPVRIYGTPILTFDNIRGRLVSLALQPIDMYRQCIQFRIHGNFEGVTSNVPRLTVGIFGYMGTCAELRYVNEPKWESPFDCPPLIYSLKNQHLNTVELWGFPKQFSKAPKIRIYSANHVDKF